MKEVRILRERIVIGVNSRESKGVISRDGVKICFYIKNIGIWEDGGLGWLLWIWECKISV